MRFRSRRESRSGPRPRADKIMDQEQPRRRIVGITFSVHGVSEMNNSPVGRYRNQGSGEKWDVRHRPLRSADAWGRTVARVWFCPLLSRMEGLKVLIALQIDPASTLPYQYPRGALSNRAARCQAELAGPFLQSDSAKRAIYRRRICDSKRR